MQGKFEIQEQRTISRSESAADSTSLSSALKATGETGETGATGEMGERTAASCCRTDMLDVAVGRRGEGSREGGWLV